MKLKYRIKLALIKRRIRKARRLQEDAFVTNILDKIAHGEMIIQHTSKSNQPDLERLFKRMGLKYEIHVNNIGGFYYQIPPEQ